AFRPSTDAGLQLLQFCDLVSFRDRAARFWPARQRSSRMARAMSHQRMPARFLGIALALIPMVSASASQSCKEQAEGQKDKWSTVMQSELSKDMSKEDLFKWGQEHKINFVEEANVGHGGIIRPDLMKATVAQIECPADCGNYEVRVTTGMFEERVMDYTA